MNKLKLLFFALPFVALAACTNGNKPEAVAEKFNKLIYTADFEGAKALCTDESKKAIDFVAAFVSEKKDQMKKANIKFVVKEVKIAEDGNSADVKGVVLGSIDLLNGGVKDSVNTRNHLIKSDNKWLVEFKAK
jgi:hypothetical protein